MIEFSLQKQLQAANGNMLFNVSYTVPPNAFVGIYGPSGVGKTSLLRMLAGFLNPDKGFIRTGNESWYNSSRRINLPAQKRKIGFVFQDYALFPNMTVRENLVFAAGRSADKTTVEELLSLVELDQLQHRKIQTLSGGQQQRVALSRALVRKPDLLLLDEPLSALDTILRDKMQVLLLKLHKQFGLTTVLVSHDMQEITRLADEIIFLKDGVIEKTGSPVNAYSLQSAEKLLKLHAIVAAKDEHNLFLLAGRDIFTLPVNNQNRHFEKGEPITVIIELTGISIA